MPSNIKDLLMVILRMRITPIFLNMINAIVKRSSGLRILLGREDMEPPTILVPQLSTSMSC